MPITPPKGVHQPPANQHISWAGLWRRPPKELLQNDACSRCVQNLERRPVLLASFVVAGVALMFVMVTLQFFQDKLSFNIWAGFWAGLQPFAYTKSRIDLIGVSRGWHPKWQRFVSMRCCIAWEHWDAQKPGTQRSMTIRSKSIYQFPIPRYLTMTIMTDYPIADKYKTVPEPRPAFLLWDLCGHRLDDHVDAYHQLDTGLTD